MIVGLVGFVGFWHEESQRNHSVYVDRWHVM